MGCWRHPALEQTSLNDLDKAEEVSKLKSPEMTVSRRFSIHDPGWRTEKIISCLVGRARGSGYGVMEIIQHSHLVSWNPTTPTN